MDLNDRSKMIIENSLLQNKTIAVIGLGGVGGMAAEALVRSGINELLIIDSDVFESSNLNRQILATRNEIGKLKTESAYNRFLSINPDIQITSINIRLTAENIGILKDYHIDFLIDAIDDLRAKPDLLAYCLDEQIPFISVVGTGNRLDGAALSVTTLDKVIADPLASSLRQRLRKKNINPEMIKVVCSKEERVKTGQRIPGSMIFVPGVAGLLAAGYAIRFFTNNLEK